MEDKNTLIYGHHPVIEAVKSAETIDKVMIQQGVRGEMERVRLGSFVKKSIFHYNMFLKKS